MARFIPKSKVKELNEIIADPEIQEIKFKTEQILGLKKYSHHEILSFIDLEELLGEGNFSRVYGTYEDSKVKKTIKILTITALESNKVTKCNLKNFYNEVYFLAKLKECENLMSLDGICEENMLGIVQDQFYCDLKSALDKEIIETEKQKLQIITGIANGLATIHGLENKMIHGDLKPDNILLDENLDPRITDFGCSYIVYHDIYKYVYSPITYHPPESLEYQNFTSKGDIWSFACIANQIFSLESPWPDLKGIDIRNKLKSNKKPLISEKVPQKLRSVLEKCFEIEPQKRLDALGILQEMKFILAVSNKLPNLPETLSGHSHIVFSVAFSPDGRYLATGSWDSTIKLWNLEQQGTLLTTLSSHSAPIISVAFSPDGRYLASGSEDYTIKLWNLEKQGSLLTTLSGHSMTVFSVAFSPDGRYLASGSSDKKIKLWNLVKQVSLITTLSGHSMIICSVAFSPDGRYLVSGSQDKTIKLWNLEHQGSLLTTLSGHSDFVISVAFSPDGRYLASGSWDKTIKLWNLEQQGSLLTTLSGHSDYVISVAFSPDGRYLASGSWDKTIKLWNLVKYGYFTTLAQDFKCFQIAFSPDGRYLASGSLDKTIKLWNLEQY